MFEFICCQEQHNKHRSPLLLEPVAPAPSHSPSTFSVHCCTLWSRICYRPEQVLWAWDCYNCSQERYGRRDILGRWKSLLGVCEDSQGAPGQLFRTSVLIRLVMHTEMIPSLIMSCCWFVRFSLHPPFM